MYVRMHSLCTCLCVLAVLHICELLSWSLNQVGSAVTSRAWAGMHPSTIVSVEAPSPVSRHQPSGWVCVLQWLKLRFGLVLRSGKMLFNGKERDKYFSRWVGYVEQFDSHVESCTVREGTVYP